MPGLPRYAPMRRSLTVEKLTRYSFLVSSRILPRRFRVEGIPFQCKEGQSTQLAVKRLGVKERRIRLTTESYKEALNTFNPVAVKVRQMEVNAPSHDTWGTVTCEQCDEKFNIGPNRIHGSRQSEQKCVELLQGRLSEDHTRKIPHQNSYEFAE